MLLSSSLSKHEVINPPWRSHIYYPLSLPFRMVPFCCPVPNPVWLIVAFMIIIQAINKSELVGQGAPLSSIFEPKTKEELAAEDQAKGKMKGGDVKMRKNVRVEGRTGNQVRVGAPLSSFHVYTSHLNPCR